MAEQHYSGFNMLIQKMAEAPRKIFGLPVPVIEEGAEACLTLFDPTAVSVCNVELSRSKSKNNAFNGATLKGKVNSISLNRIWDELFMDYRKIIDNVSVLKREILSTKLIDVILLSKNDDKMPSQLANTILQQWQQDTLITESGLTALLEAAVLLDPTKTVEALTALELADIAGQIKEATVKT